MLRQVGEIMQNKEQRSFILSMVLGDGCLHNTSNNVSGSLTIDHGIEQSDYINWKASFLSEVTSRNIKIRKGHKGKSIQLSVCMKKFKAWRKFCYPNGKKVLTRILPFITNPEFAIAIWLMDDGYVETNGDRKGGKFRLYTCSEPIKDQEFFIEWFKENLNVCPKIAYQKNSKTNKTYPFLKFTQDDTLIIWEKIRDFVLQFDSMKYKFRYVEELYLRKLAQRIPS